MYLYTEQINYVVDVISCHQYLFWRSLISEDGREEKEKEDIYLVIQSTNPGVCPIFRLPLMWNYKYLYGLYMLDLAFSNKILKLL